MQDHEKKERGTARITIELSDGNITIKHEDGFLLAELKDAPLGTWNKMWESFDSLGFNRTIEEN